MEIRHLAGRAEAGSRRLARAVQRLPRWLRWAGPVVLVLVLVATTVLWTQTGPPARGGRGAAAAPHGTVVSLTFNNGTAAQYRFARPLLRRYGLHGTFYLVPHRVDAGDPCCMSWQQARQLYREGDEIGASSADGADLTVPTSPDPAQDYARKQQLVCGARQRLASAGLDPRSFAYPAGTDRYRFPGLGRSLTDLVAACGYLSGRVIGGLATGGSPSSAAIALPPPAPYALRTPDEASTGPLALAPLQQAVLAAGDRPDRWVPLVFDEVCHAGDASYRSCMATGRPIDDRVLAAFLSWLHEAGLPGGAPAGTTVRTVRQVMGAPPPPPLPPSQTVVSLTFDDGDATQLLVEPLLRAHGLPGTFFIVTGRLDAGNPANMSWADVLRLAREGNEIGGHTVSHVDLTDPRLPEAVKTQEVCGNRSRLQQMGLDPVSFAYPYGTSDPAVEALVRSCGYRTARTGGGADPDSATPAETLPPADPFATRALHTPPSGPWTSAALERAVTAAALNGGGWVQVPFHRICVPTDAQFAACMSGDAPIERGAFDSFLGWLQHSAPRGTTVRTVGDVIRSAG